MVCNFSSFCEGKGRLRKSHMGWLLEESIVSSSQPFSSLHNLFKLEFQCVEDAPEKGPCLPCLCTCLSALVMLKSPPEVAMGGDRLGPHHCAEQLSRRWVQAVERDKTPPTLCAATESESQAPLPGRAFSSPPRQLGPRKQPGPSPRNCGSPGTPKAASRLFTPTRCLPVLEQSG